MDSQQLLIYGFAYFIFLIAIAWLAERSGRWPRMFQAMVYGLSLGVYCSSWTFLGAVGNASAGGWSFLPIYLGPILLFVIGWPFVRKLMVIGARNKVTSLADFIGSRYGKDQRLAALVTLVAVIGTLPYIALQLRAIALAWSSANVADWLQPFQTDNTASLFAAIFLGWFAIIFGTRVIEGEHRHRGLLTAVATESIVKLVAFFGLALFALYLLISVPNEQAPPSVPTSFNLTPFLNINFYAQLIIAAAAIFCLPRQFHVMVVEYHDRLSTRLSRWLFPIYLLLFAICVVPIVEAGRLFLADSSIPPDSYVLSLPAVHDQSWLMLLAFLGALSAATSMVLVATVALSIMISNELIVPLYLNFRAKDRFKHEDLAGALRYVRRLAVIGILFLSWLLDQTASRTGGLSSMGLLAFASSAQLMPSIVAGLYWGQGHRKGVIVGILIGCLVWGYCLLLPALLPTNDTLLLQGPWGIELLRPQSLFGTGAFLDSLSHGVFWSLGLNILLFIVVSNRSKFSTLDIRQAYAFLELRRRYSYSKEDYEPTAIEIHKLQSLINPLLGPVVTGYFWSELEQKLQHRLLPYMAAPRFVVQQVEDKLASIIGAVSAHRAIDMLRKQKPLQMEDIATLMGGTSQQLQFSQSLLQTTLENIPQGISVVDENLNLVAWNHQYEQLFNYPPELLFVGCPIERIYRHNAMQGLLSDSGNNIDAAVKKRLLMLRTGLPYRLERRFPNNIDIESNRVIEIQGTPIPSGGYVTAFTDVTAYHKMMADLEEAKEDLEIRVAERTEELSQANTFLKLENQMRARIETELKEVHASKNRFLAAASHDLLQPINAARLLLAAVNRQGSGQIPNEFTHVDSALANAEAVVSSLREIAKLDSGKLTPNPEPVSVNSILEGLCNEFSTFADKSQLDLRYSPSQCWVYSDQVLLRRVIQNFLSNAIRYTRRGKVLVGCRRRKDSLAIEVWDTGPGIAEKDQSRIFEEFERIDVHSNDDTKGLGLGLSISLRIAQLLGHALELKSWPGKGSIFRVIVPLANEVKAQPKEVYRNDPALKGLRVLCIDNEPHLLAGLQALLSQWGCEVTAAASLNDVLSKWQWNAPPDLVIADYQLDNNETGLQVLSALQVHWQGTAPTLIISADNSEEMQDKVKQQGYQFLAKPVQPANLRLTLRRLLRNFVARS
ncbi:MAG: hybrid sensor histidine kinase/response regulator [Pseudomonadales bacterium]|nr:hybrid sensor histidine kinase/response regulator [Pseudomonadales bacterium]